MRLVLAQMKHETNTFSPVPTPIARFARARPLPPEGRDAYDACKGTGHAIAAFIDLAEAAGAEIDIPIAASAWPSGPVEDAAFEYIATRICDAVARGCDGVLLDLHGAMVTERVDDGEAELLRRIRRLAPEVPIGVALDMHANLSPAMAEAATVIAGYQTYPHVDVYETGLRAGRPILSMLAGGARPRLAWGARPMLPHVMRQSSLDEPNKSLQARCRALESDGALAASLFTGFPHADTAEAGVSAVVVTDGLLRFASGAVHSTIYFPEAKAFYICHPSISEQRRLVGVLDHALGEISTAKVSVEKNARSAAGVLDAHLYSIFLDVMIIG